MIFLLANGFFGSFENVRFSLAVNAACVEQKGCHMFIWRYFFYISGIEF